MSIATASVLEQAQPLQLDNFAQISTLPMLQVIAGGKSEEPREERLQQELEEIPTQRHLTLFEAYVDRWLERIDSLDYIADEIHAVFLDNEKYRSHVVATIANTFMSNLDGDFLDEMTSQDIDWIARQTAREVPEAARKFELAGESEEFYTMHRRLNRPADQLKDWEKKGEVLFFEAFGWKWLPVWQFDEQSRRPFPVISELIKLFPDGEIQKHEQLMYWAIRPCKKLKNLPPAHWIREHKSNTILFDSLNDTLSGSITQSNSNSSLDAIQESSTYNGNTRSNRIEKQIVNRLMRKIDVLKNKPHIYSHLPGFLETANVYPGFPPSEFTEAQLRQGGELLADRYISGYPYLGSFVHELFQHRSSLVGIGSEVCNLVGLQAAKRINRLIALIESIGPRLTNCQVKEILNCSDDQLATLEKENSLISFCVYEHQFYPDWQFDPVSRTIRPIATQLIQFLKPPKGFLSNYEIASWATTKNTDGLTGFYSPAEWMSDADKDPAKILDVASRLLSAMNV